MVRIPMIVIIISLYLLNIFKKEVVFHTISSSSDFIWAYQPNTSFSASQSQHYQTWLTAREGGSQQFTMWLQPFLLCGCISIFLGAREVFDGQNMRYQMQRSEVRNEGIYSTCTSLFCHVQMGGENTCPAKCYAVQQSVTQCSKMLHGVATCYAVQQNVKQCSNVLRSVAKCYTVQLSVMQCSKVLRRESFYICFTSLPYSHAFLQLWCQLLA